MTPPLQPALRTYRPSDRDALMSLWSSCGLLRPSNDPRLDIERKLVHDPGGLLVLEADGCLAGSVMVGYDGHRGWVNYLAVNPAWQGRGLGRMLMDKAEQRLLALGCPKVNLQVRTSNEHAVAIYRHLGYGTDDVVSMGKRPLDDAAPGQPPNSARPRRADPEAHRTPETGRFTSLTGIKRIPAQIRRQCAHRARQGLITQRDVDRPTSVSRSPPRRDSERLEYRQGDGRISPRSASLVKVRQGGGGRTLARESWPGEFAAARRFVPR
jgi:GNAT superfamily N-acetyltransferase